MRNFAYRDRLRRSIANYLPRTLRVGALLCLVNLCLMPTLRSQTLAVEHVTVISMESPQALSDQTVVIANGRITRVGDSRTTLIPGAARRIDGRGKYLLPGLADMHVHLQSPTELPLFLAYGVTTAFDLNGKSPYLDWRRAINAGSMLGPQLFLCGPYFNDPEPVDVAMRRVDEIAQLGYDAIKIKNNVTTVEFDAIVAEAKLKGLLLMGHTPRQPGLFHAVDAGMSLAHEEEILYGAFSPDGGNTVVPNNDRATEVAARIKAAGVYVTPNLVMYDHIYRQATDYAEFAARPEFRLMSPWALDRFHNQNPYKGWSAKDQQDAKINLAFMNQVLTPALHAAGVPLLAGTDAEDLGTLAGASLIDELELLEGTGLTPFEALQTATTNAARYLHREDDFGQVKSGMRADLILTDRNPLETTKNLRYLAGVIVNGKWLPRSRLELLKRQIPERYAAEQKDLLRQLRGGNYSSADRYLAFNDPYQRVPQFLLKEILRQDGLDQTVALMDRIHREYPALLPNPESVINSLAYSLMNGGRLDDAIRVFKQNVAMFPRSANAQDSLAEAFDRNKDIPQAVTAYMLALEIDPAYGNAGAARQYVQTHTGGRQ